MGGYTKNKYAGDKDKKGRSGTGGDTKYRHGGTELNQTLMLCTSA
jgi:hypothetical protein